MVNRKRNIQIHVDIDDAALEILKNKLKKNNLSIQEFFQNRIKKPVRYIDTEHRFEMKRINNQINETGKKINNISVRIKTENIYESDINTIYNLIANVINSQKELNGVISKYFETMKEVDIDDE